MTSDAFEATRDANPSSTRELIQLAWPMTAAMIGESFNGLVDIKLVGGLGADALGGVALGTMYLYLGYAVMNGIMRGVKTCTAHAVGEGKPRDGFLYARAGILLCALIGLAIMVACHFAAPLLRGLGTDPAIVSPASDFLAAVSLGALPTCVLAALVQHRHAIGDARTPMIASIGGNVVNGLLAWGLIYGHFGLPALGVRGAGFATAMTKTLEVSVMLGMLARSQRRAAASAPSPGALSVGAAARRIVALGAPTGVQYGVEMLGLTTFATVLGGIGGHQIAAHQIALGVMRFSSLPGIAIGEAASVLVGRALGRRNLAEADAAVTSGLRLAVGFMGACGLLFWLGGGAIAEFFTHEPDVVAVARKLLILAAVFQVFEAIYSMFRAALRSAKDVRMGMVIGIVVMWVFVPTSAYFLGKQAGLGAVGGWIGFIGETSVGSLLLWRRWSRGAWRKDYAPAV